MPTLFVNGAGTDIGKTFVSAALIRAMRAEGRAIEAFKPVVSGFDPAAPLGSDPAVLLEALGEAWTPETLDRMSPLRFLAPLSPPLAARREGAELTAEAIIDLCRARMATAGEALLLIEGAGGAMSPVDDDRTMLDLTLALEAPTLLVAGSYLGAISHALTARVALQGAGVSVAAIVVSESLDAPPLDETVEAMARLCGETPVLAVRRGAAMTPGQLDTILTALRSVP